MADKKRGKVETSGALEGHLKVGRLFQPPLMALEQTILSDWSRDDLPDLLWPLSLVLIHGDAGARRMSDAQGAILTAVSGDELDNAGAPVDGRLTSLERIPRRLRADVRRALRTLPFEVFPPELIGVTQLFDDVPGAWALNSFEGHEADLDATANLLADAIVSAADTRLTALVKTAPIGWLIYRRKLTLPTEVVDMLKNYPADSATRPQAEAFILSSFLALKGAAYSQRPELESATKSWARSFWNQAWMSTPCLVSEAIAPSQVDEGVGLEGLEERSRSAIIRAETLYTAFSDRAMSHELPADMYEPSRHEVLTALAARAYRSVRAVLATPHMWTSEHGSHAARLLFETRVTIRWLIEEGGDEGFHRYQDYGRGKRKLLLRHIKSLAQQPSESAAAVISAFDAKAGGDMGDAFQTVDLSATFAGITLREMAETVGERAGYASVFAATSGILHGEWWTLEDYAMQRCANPLHRFHFVPSLESPLPDEEFPELLLAHLKEVLSVAEGGLVVAANEDSVGPRGGTGGSESGGGPPP